MYSIKSFILVNGTNISEDKKRIINFIYSLSLIVPGVPN